MPIVSIYAAMLSLLFVALSIRIIRARRKRRIAIGDGGDKTMLRVMRVHSNFAEYVPLSLLMIYFVETSGYPAGIVHALGICLLVGRLCHAYGVSKTAEIFVYRVSGMVMTFTVLVTAAILLLFSVLVGSAT